MQLCVHRLLTLCFIITFFQSTNCKSIKDTKFKKYTYESNFTDREIFQSTFTRNHLNILKNETKSLFTYSWEKYMEFGYPYDEVCPLTCKPNKRDFKNQFNTVKNDVLGEFSITLFDSIDTFILMNDKESFRKYVKLINENFKNFEIDSTVQIFETNIRLLGSLLTLHLYAIDDRRGFKIDDYDGFLLKLAYDLGKRLILSFNHFNEDDRFTDISKKAFTFNYPRTNLMYGPAVVSNKLMEDQCTAGVTSLTLEFSLLSRLTNDPIFEDVSRRSVLDFWSKRSNLDLIPMSLNTKSRLFVDSTSGIGASIDSFYEYALKYSILFDDDLFLNIWKDAYKSLLTHSQNKNGIFTNLNADTGLATTEWIDSLSAFFPGLQVLSGDIKNSVELHKLYFKLWNNYASIPERWNILPLRSEQYFSSLDRPYRDGDVIPGFNLNLTNELLVKNSVSLEWYPLRPEFIESTYHLYRATKDPFYLRIGEDVLEVLRKHYLAPCGFSGSLDVINDRRQNRQESFVLSETLKYLYLLFDVDNDIQKGNTIFTTEGHPFWYDNKILELNSQYKLNLNELNHWNKTEESEQVGLLSRFLNNPKFILNKEFNNLKTMFYETIKDIKPIIYRIQDLYSFEISSNGKILGNKYGQRMRINEADYEIVKSIDENNLKLNAGLLSSVYSKDYLDLDKCQIIPQSTQFVHSSILNDDHDFYRLDWEYAMTLRKPLYLIDNKGLEMDDQFYSVFVNASKSMCNAQQTSAEWEALMCSDENYNVAPIFKYLNMEQTTNATGPKDGDLFIVELDGLRLRLEETTVGDVDSFGNVVTHEYLDQLLANADDNISRDSIMRVTKVNGYTLAAGESVWTLFNQKTFVESNKQIGLSDNCVVLNGCLVANLHVQYL